MRRRAALAGAVLALATLGSAPGARAADGAVTFITADEVRRLDGTRERPLLVDVRTREEFDDAHIVGAVSIPLAELERRADAIPRERLVVLY